MSMTIVLWAGVIAALAAAVASSVAIHRVVRARLSSWSPTLGRAPLLLLCLGATVGVDAWATNAWIDAGERHVVTVRPERSSSRCHFDWPAPTAAAKQTIHCPSDVAAPTPLQARRAPGTDFVVLIPPSRLNPISAPMHGAALVLGGAGATGAAINRARASRRSDDRRRAELNAWLLRRTSTPATPAGSPVGTDDLTWDEIAAASERAPLGAGPLAEPGRYTDVSAPAPQPLPMHYPFAFTRVMTQVDGAPASALLLFVGDDAWRVISDAVTPRAGTAVITRNPSQHTDLRVSIDGYDYDIADEPVFLSGGALRALRRHATAWVSDGDALAP